MAKKRPDPAAIQQMVQQAYGLMEAGQFAQAEHIYRDVLKQSSTNVDALHGLGQLHYRQGRPAEALVIYDRLRVMLPRHPAVLSDRGNALKHLGRLTDALADYDKALVAAPDHIASLYNRGNVLLELNRPTEALESYERALAINPDLSVAMVNRGNALRKLNRFDDALASYRAALAHRPNDPDTLNNYGTTLFDVGRDMEAIPAFEAALAQAPQFHMARYNLALAHLRQGDFAAGWAAYETRWETSFFLPHRRRFDVPLWLGRESVAGKTVLLYAEQGFGDAIQFVRFLPQVAALGAKVIVEMPESLIDLMTGFAGDARIVPPNTQLPPFDFHCPLMSLPHALGITVDTIPVPIPYLAPPTDKMQSWRDRIHSRPGTRVGLVWSGRPEHHKDAQRSIPLPQLDPLPGVNGLQFFSLQKELRASDAVALTERPQIVALGDDFHSFADTAAAIAALDLVITVDTSVAHLAGAMGKPVWILLPTAPDFRWLTERADSPWYPTARLFRQTKAGEWSSVVADVANELGKTDLFPNS